MEYSLEQITTASDCDALLTAAEAHKFNLELDRKEQEKTYRLVLSTAGIESALSAAIAELASVESVIASEPDSPFKEEMKRRVPVLQVKINNLTSRSQRYGKIALLQKEYAMTCFDRQLEENDAYVTAVKERKGTL